MDFKQVRPKLKNLRKSKKIWISVTHGLLLFVLLWYINNTSFSTSIDEGLIKKFFIVEDLIFPGKTKIPHNFVFIDVSSDISLIKDPKSLGNITITDRKKLADFFKLLADNDNQHQFVLCDVYFDYPSCNDKLLSEQISRCTRLIFPFQIKNEASEHSVIKVSSALASYETFNDKFSKFKLVYNDTVKTIPVALLEKIYSTTYRPGFFYFNSYSPRYYIRPYQLEQKEFSYFKLGDLLGLPLRKDILYTEFFKDRFIVLGNFKSDIHNTPIGKVSGPLILIDSYLSLEMGRNHFNVWWVAFMLISLSLTSYVLFFVKIAPPKTNVSLWVDFILHNFLNKIFSFLGICTAIAFISEILFSIPITISPLFFYLTYMSWAISFFNEHHKFNLL